MSICAKRKSGSRRTESVRGIGNDGTRPASPICQDHTDSTRGSYLAERQWATVREDYSYVTKMPLKILQSCFVLHNSRENGDAWSHFTHDDARSRAFRWGEDGIAGVCDSHGLLNIAFSFWNEKESVQLAQFFLSLSENMQRLLERTIIRPLKPTREPWREYQRSPLPP